ncbi:uncharacterized protein LOC132036588 isoform X2 [Lycium ferocissimum]|uniref:uncharacterized protein LOC132036588 isoform X2 n=1 Tax=Lycium ferocissimum TaxID=112874 RepID=UPI0028157E6F|nr:uncharacterized protein LOC132036588 isoform X2 [Lycium ferocissimum]
MAIQCSNFVPYLSCSPSNKEIPSSFIRFPATHPFYVDSNKFKLSTPRFISALVSDNKALDSNYSGTDMFRLTYLEGNSWLWEVGGLKILVDPILVGNLDFGIPWLYDAAKKILKNFQVIYLEPGQDSEIEVSNGFPVKVKATAGPVLGPPWQRPENGYLVTSPNGALTLYYEPHCVYNKTFVEKDKADIVITPVIKQLLPSFTLVSGQEDAVQLAKHLSAKFVVPMKNGDLDSKGFLASIVQSEGTMESFKELLSKELPDAKVLEPTPGEPLDISIAVLGQ